MNSEIRSLNIYNYIGSTLYLTFGLACVSSSILVLYICLTKCSKKSTEIALICIFCVLESFTGATYVIVSIFKLKYGYKVNEKGTIMCNFIAFLIVLLPRINIINISILATLRYLIFCRSKDLILSTWIITLFVIDSGALIFISLGFYTKDAAPSSSYLYCNIFTKQSGLSTVALYFIPLLFIIPCWVTTYCYLMVGWIANKKLNLMRQEAANNEDRGLLEAIKNQKFKLLLQILFIFVNYNVNFALSYITWIMKLVANYKRTITVDFIVCIQVAFAALLNPVVTIVFQPDINNEFNFLWIKLKLRIIGMYKKYFNR
jgi:hypothetical protein